MRQSSLYILFTCSFLLLCWSLAAQELPRIISFDPSRISGRDQVWGITQQADQQLWMANSGAVLSFDGVRWDSYPLPNGQIPRSIATDSLGRIYVGGYTEFGYWELADNGQRQYYSLSQELVATSIRTEEIWNIIPFAKGVLFQSFSTVYYYNYEETVEISPPGIIMFIREVNERLIFPVISRGLYSWQSGEQFQFLTGTESLAGKRVISVLPHQGGLLIATEQHGLWLYQDQQLSVWQPEGLPNFADVQLNKVIGLKNGRLALGTILNGLYVASETGQLIYHINQEKGLQNNTVLALFEDRQGDLWVGLDRGLDLIVLSAPLLYNTDQDIGTVYAAAVWNDNLYIGTNQGLFQRPWSRQEDYQLVEGSQGQVWSLEMLGDQLLCGHNDGSFMVAEEGIRWVSDVTGGWQSLPIPDHPKWRIQCTYTGLVLFHQIGGEWEMRQRIAGINTPVKQIAWDGDKGLWAVHPSRGLFRYSFNATYDSILHQKEYAQSEGLPNTYALQLSKFSDTLLVYADSLAYQWQEEEQRFQVLQQFRGQHLPAQSRLLQGVGKDWFLSVGQEVFLYSDSSSLRLPVGLVQDYPRIFHLPNGYYLFCLANGYALLPPTGKSASPNEWPLPKISRVDIQSEKGRRSKLHAPDASPITLEAQQNQLSFYFSQAVYTRQPKYRYRLLGISPEWSDWTSTAYKEFTFLRPGSYQFEVQSNQSDATTSFSFRILPHWYQTTWAYLLYGLLGLGFLWFLYRLHVKRLRNQERRLILERERQLIQERIRTRNEQLKADVLRKSQELANSTFTLIQKNESLRYIKEELDKVTHVLQQRDSSPKLHKLRRMIDRHLSNDREWAVFEENFNEVHEVFFKRLTENHPQLTPGDLKLAAYLRMNLSTKEIAPLLGISIRGVENKRYRLRRKLDLEGADNLVSYLLEV